MDTGVRRPSALSVTTAVLGLLVSVVMATAGGVLVRPDTAAAASGQTGTMGVQVATPAVSGTAAMTVLTVCPDRNPANCRPVQVPATPGTPADGFGLFMSYTLGSAQSVPDAATFAGFPLPATVGGQLTPCGGRTGLLVSMTGAKYRGSSATVALTRGGAVIGTPVALGGGEYDTSERMDEVFYCVYV